MIRRIFVYFLILAIFFPAGCYSLRKKFVRKKKRPDEAAVYVDFKEYTAPPSREVYIDHYLFARGWIDELSKAAQKGEGFKRRRRAANEIVMNFEQMLSFYSQEGKDKIYPLYEEFIALKNEIDNTPDIGEVRRISIIKKIEYLYRRFEVECKYSDVQRWIQ